MTTTMIRRDGQVSEILLGSLGAQVKLLGYDGVEKNPIGGAVISTGNYNLIVDCDSGDHANFGSGVLLVRDSGVSVGVALVLSQTVTFSNPAPIIFTATAVRITGPFEAATRNSRPFFQSSATNGDTNVSAMPSGSNSIAKFEAYNGSAPNSATGIASLEANGTEIRLTAGFSTGSGLPLQIYVGGVKAIDVAITGDLAFPAAIYTAFTPGITQNGVRTVSAPIGHYRLFGKFCHLQVRAICTNAGTAGNAITLTGIPSAIAPLATGNAVVQGQFQVRTASGFRTGSAYFATGTTIAGIADADADALGTVTGGNFALANGDIISANMMFEIA